jgi:hypothetical protein
MIPALVVSCLIAAVVSAPATAKTVRVIRIGNPLPGRSLSVVAHGLRPGSRVSPFVLTGPTNSCCGVGVGKTKVVPRSGRLRFHFDWPRFYYRCLENHGRNCRRSRWRKGARATVEVASPQMHPFPHSSHKRRQSARAGDLLLAPTRLTRTAMASTAGPVDPLPSRNIPYKGCPGSSWMTSAGTTGSGSQAEISFAPTEKTRLLGRYFSEDVWSDLQNCVPFPGLSQDEVDSVYAQFLCHVEFGISSSITGSTFDLQAWRPKAWWFTVVKAKCSPPLGDDAADQYSGDIIQWTADTNPQKTAWWITKASNGKLQRRWIPTSQIYYCLKGKGAGGPVALDHDFIEEYLAPTGPDVGQAEACGSAPAAPPGGGSTPAPPPTPGGGSPSPSAQTWSEQETPNHPVNTFLNYHNASGVGPAVAAGQWVQVSCKVYDPYIQSVNPDGYWYRIASSPWNNAYYSPANTFMNGDPYGGPYTHNTDFAVPNC